MSVLSDYPYHTINHNLRLYILSFLPFNNYYYNQCECADDHSIGGCPKRDYGYFLSDPTRTIYRTNSMHDYLDLEYCPNFLTCGGYFSGTKSITLYFHLNRLPGIEQELQSNVFDHQILQNRLRSFIQHMHRQTIILSIHIPMTIEATDKVMNITKQSWPKNVVFGIHYDYTDDANVAISENDHKSLFQHLKNIVGHPLIRQIELSRISIDTVEQPFISQHYYDLLETTPKKHHKKFLCTDPNIFSCIQNDQHQSQTHLLATPRFWQLVVPTFFNCSVAIRTELCPKEILDAFLEHGFPRLDSPLKHIPCGLLKEIVNRPHLHQYLSKELEIFGKVDLCELVDLLTKIKLDKLMLPHRWTVSDWILLEQKIQQVFAKWGPETPIHIEGCGHHCFSTDTGNAGWLYIYQIKCDLVNLPTALSREIAAALSNKRKHENNN